MNTPRYELCMPCKVEGLWVLVKFSQLQGTTRGINKVSLRISVTAYISLFIGWSQSMKIVLPSQNDSLPTSGLDVCYFISPEYEY